MRLSVDWDDPPPSGGTAWFKGFAILWVVVVGGISTAILFGEHASPPSPVSGGISGAPPAIRIDTADTSYSGYRGRALGINGDGAAVQLDDFEGSFIWVDMEGPWCSASGVQSQEINAVRHRRGDVVFLTLVTSGPEPLTRPTRSTALEWANEQRLQPSQVVAYESAIAIPHHILYSPQGHELMRVTETLSADRLEGILNAAIASWRQRVGLVVH